MLVAFACASAMVIAHPAFGAEAVDRKAVIAQARKSYLNLRAKGLLKFKCNLVPTWELVLADVKKSDPERAAAALKQLEPLRFQVMLGSSDEVQVTHNTIGVPNEQLAALKQVYDGMEQMVAGFFQTWSPYMLTDPFPPTDSDYKLEDLGPKYRVSYKEPGNADVVLVINKDFTVAEMKATTPEFEGIIRPTFEKSPAGFLLTAYEADYQPASVSPTHLHVEINYQEVSKLQLPKKLYVAVGMPVDTRIELAFTDCSVEKK
jgi:hypothetical protein